VIKIREGVWQTNSSSSHSLSIRDKVNIGELKEKVKNKLCYDDILTVGSGEYAWGYEQLTHWTQKADYLGVEARDNGKQKIFETALRQVLGQDLEIVYSDDGYIDHQSIGRVWSYIETVYDVINVVFGESIIEIDNDNGPHNGKKSYYWYAK